MTLAYRTFRHLTSELARTLSITLLRCPVHEPRGRHLPTSNLRDTSRRVILLRIKVLIGVHQRPWNTPLPILQPSRPTRGARRWLAAPRRYRQPSRGPRQADRPGRSVFRLSPGDYAARWAGWASGRPWAIRLQGRDYRSLALAGSS